MRPSRRLRLSTLIIAIGLVAGTATGAVYVARSAPDASRPAPFASVVAQPRAAHHAPSDLPPQVLYSTPPPGLTPLPVRVTATPTATASATPRATPSATPTATASATPTAHPTGSATPTPAPTSSATPQPTPSASATPGH